MEDKIDFSKYVYYDETSPTFLRWKVDRNKGVVIGSKAGTIEYDKEKKATGVFLTLMKKSHSVNRIVWELFHGKLTQGQTPIHRDGCKSNNSISNLRLKVKSDYPSKLKTSVRDKRILSLWSGAKERTSNSTREVPETYKGATMHPEWVTDSLAFQEFVLGTPNWDSKDQNGKWFNIEKDLFGFNSDKFGYHPETICFLPRDLNQALQLEHEGQRSANKGLPVGVTYEKGRYKAQISVNGKPKYLGTGNVEECAELYRKAKVSRLEELIEIWKPVLPEKVTKQLHLFVSHLKAF